MAHQFVREPLRAEEADRLANACRSPEEKLIKDIAQRGRIPET
jgi:integrase/recombinase XerD